MLTHSSLRTLSFYCCFVLVSLGTQLSGCKESSTSTANNSAPSKVSVRFPIPIIESGQTTFYEAEDNEYYADEQLDVEFEMGSRELNPYGVNIQLRKS